MIMFFGRTSSRSSSGRRCRLQRFRSAIATARLALCWPMIYLSSSSTVWRGVRELSKKASGVEDEGPRFGGLGIGGKGPRYQSYTFFHGIWLPDPVCRTLPLQFFYRNFLVRIYANLACDLHGFEHYC